MAITEAQRVERRKHLGASDIGALFTDKNDKSIDPFKTATGVYLNKVYGHENEKETAAMKRGNRYEAALMEYASEELGRKIVTDADAVEFTCEKHPIFQVHLDGYTIPRIEGDVMEVVEAKTTSMGDEWGDPGTEDVPFRVMLQVQCQMFCANMKKANIVVLLGKFDRLCEEIYYVERKEDIINFIIERGEQFWRDYVMTETPPPEMSAHSDLGIYKTIIREPNKYATVDPNVILNYDGLRQNRLDAEKEEKAALADVLKLMGDAEAAVVGGGKEFTYFMQGRADVDRKKLRQEFPEAFAACQKKISYRKAAIRKVK